MCVLDSKVKTFFILAASHVCYSNVLLCKASIHSSSAENHSCVSTVNGKERQVCSIGDNILHMSNITIHLGLVRTDKDDCGVNVADRISLARRTWYSLMKSGSHGSNGLNPKVSYRMYHTYVMPRMLYSLEILDLRKTDLKLLSDFHTGLLRKIQPLPSRTALSAVYFLVGLPLEAELHKRHLSLLFSIVPYRNSTLHELVQKAICLHGILYDGFVKSLSDTLDLYDHILESTPTK